jgi:hypothetical protein
MSRMSTRRIALCAVALVIPACAAPMGRVNVGFYRYVEDVSTNGCAAQVTATLTTWAKSHQLSWQGETEKQDSTTGGARIALFSKLPEERCFVEVFYRSGTRAELELALLGDPYGHLTPPAVWRTLIDKYAIGSLWEDLERVSACPVQ